MALVERSIEVPLDPSRLLDLHRGRFLPSLFHPDFDPRWEGEGVVGMRVGRSPLTLRVLGTSESEITLELGGGGLPPLVLRRTIFPTEGRTSVRDKISVEIEGRKRKELLLRFVESNLEHLRCWATLLGSAPPFRRVAITGSSGLVGSHLVHLFECAGWEVLRVVRRAPGPREVRWNPKERTIDTSPLEGLDLWIHLSGESIGRRWTPARKREILESRIQSTSLLTEILLSLRSPPSLLLSASAVGYYGDRGEEVLTEESPPGVGFLSEVCRKWEEATSLLKGSGIPVANLRFGTILSARGGALPRLLSPLRWRVGSSPACPSTWWSWIDILDVLGAILAIEKGRVEGPVNVVSNPVRFGETTGALTRWCKGVELFPIPRSLLLLLWGEMAKETILSSQRVHPSLLQRLSYAHLHPTIESAIRYEVPLGPLRIFGRPSKAFPS